jgi:quercetin dioxygenase-like cupin family protein
MQPQPTSSGAPRVLCDVEALSALGPETASAIAWRLQEPSRQLDANLVHLAAHERIDTHTEADLDVLAVIVAGGGILHTDEGDEPLYPGAVAWLPHGAARSLAASASGLAYLTVHLRRPGLRIRPGHPE